MYRTRWALLALAALLGGVLFTASAQGPDKKKTPPTLADDVATDAKVKREIAEKVLKALGPAVRAQLSAGKQVNLPGIGTFQVVRIAEYKDLASGGRPTIVPARNYVEFVPGGEMDGAANAPGAVPARTVEGYEFRVNPNGTPGMKVGPQRTLGTRTR